MCRFVGLTFFEARKGWTSFILFYFRSVIKPVGSGAARDHECRIRAMIRSLCWSTARCEPSDSNVRLRPPWPPTVRNAEDAHGSHQTPSESGHESTEDYPEDPSHWEAIAGFVGGITAAGVFMLKLVPLESGWR